LIFNRKIQALFRGDRQRHHVLQASQQRFAGRLDHRIENFGLVLEGVMNPLSLDANRVGDVLERGRDEALAVD
jgi:hypothetical protein